MPMFMLISGYLGKRQPLIRKIVRNYFIPYIVFDYVYVIYAVLRGGTWYTDKKSKYSHADLCILVYIMPWHNKNYVIFKN